ncbi:MAG: Eco29kI family restriction endonuclease [Candidatus Nanopelagicales bacterium]|nr:Eco29kI family restriction endonuclease [Candidatus Nanopelagicales bacterium]
MSADESSELEGLLGTSLDTDKFNPLALDVVGRNLREGLEARPRIRLDRLPHFTGAGLYALYYIGKLPIYQPLIHSDIPVYVGKAEAGNSSYGDAPDDSQPRLFKRITEKHAKSIREVSENDGNIAPSDFEVRRILLEYDWIVLGERALLRAYAPVLWNTLMPGFGANPPGTARKNARSIWDTIHPGRPRAGEVCNRRFTRTKMESRIRDGIAVSFMDDGPARDQALKELRDRRAAMIWSPAKKNERDRRFRVFRTAEFMYENLAINSPIADSEWRDASNAELAETTPDPEEAAEQNVLDAEGAPDADDE